MEKLTLRFLAVFSLPLLVVNFLRIAIVLNGYIELGRLPKFTDGFTKASIFNQEIDEVILLFGHFFNLLFVVVVLLTIITGLHFEGAKTLKNIIVLLALFSAIIDVWIRFLDVYGYIYFD